MAKKLKKAKKSTMSPRTKNILINSFKGIISNQACIDNGKEAPWWLAVLFLIFSVLIPLIPNHIQMSQSYGSSFLANGSFGMDIGLARASAQLKKEGKTLGFTDKGLLTYSGTERDQEAIFKSVSQVNNQFNFKLYYTEAEGSGFNSLYNIISKTQYKEGTTDIYNKETDADYYAYTPSFVLLSTKTIAAATFKENTTKMAGQLYVSNGGLNWSNTKKTDLVERAVAKFTDENGDPLTDFSTLDLATISQDNVKAAYKVWKAIFNETYIQQRDKAKWTNTLIYLGVYAGLMFFLGLMVFLLTRGKNNPFRVYNFWICQKIAYFLGFTPAVLALILGFIFAANFIGQMAFIMLLSLRVMWASMRQLRPVYTQQ